MTPMPARRDEAIYRELHESAARLEVLACLTRGAIAPGNSAVIGLRAVRPEVLRPRLSTGLLLDGAGQARALVETVQVACQPI